MSKIRHILCLILLFSGVGLSYAQRPVQSDPIYYQLRSMETGPWEFRPEGYYYSWVNKRFLLLFEKKPGLGVHDRGPGDLGGGDNYVNRYKPSGKVRAKMLALAEISRKNYEAIADKYEDIGKRELLDVTDRQVNLAIKVYDSRISSLVNNITALCRIYDQVRQTEASLALGHTASTPFREELTRIQSNISLIGKSYIRNAERSSAYLKELENLERLSMKLKWACKKAYTYKRMNNVNNLKSDTYEHGEAS